MILSYWSLFLLDVTILLICLGLMLRFGRLAVLHPASLYFFFHFYTFTFRLFQLANGAPTLFERWHASFLPVTQQEIQRAELVALLSLLTMTLIWLYLASKERPQTVVSDSIMHYRPFSKRVMWTVTSITLPVGLVALILLRGPILSGGNTLSLGNWTGSGYLTSMYQWFGISLLALIYYYGFHWVLSIAFLLYLGIGLLTFPFRMMVILPALFVVFVYIRRRRTRWIPLRLFLPIAILILLFVAGKELGPTLRQGDFDRGWDLIVGRVAQMETGEHVDAMFMDQLACALSQVDARGDFFYGKTYLNIFLLPIPRALWQDKPGQADWQKELESPGRPTAAMGAIVTALGEAYANFGYPGVVLYAVTLAWILHRLYHWMLQAPYYSIINFWSLCIYGLLIQVFRDGLISFVTFQVTVFMPLTIITLLHVVVLRRRISFNRRIISWSTIFDHPNAYIDNHGRTRNREYRSRLAP